MISKADRVGAREIFREGRAGDLPWSAVIYDHDGERYDIAEVKVAGEPLLNALPDASFASLDEALTAIAEAVTGNAPTP